MKLKMFMLSDVIMKIIYKMIEQSNDEINKKADSQQHKGEVSKDGRAHIVDIPSSCQWVSKAKTKDNVIFVKDH